MLPFYFRRSFLKGKAEFNGRLQARYFNGNSSKKRETDLIFKLYSDPNTQRISIYNFLSVLHENGLANDDPRLQSIINKIKEVTNVKIDNPSLLSSYKNLVLDRESFHKCIEKRLGVIKKVLKNEMVIPDWKSFTEILTQLFEECEQHVEGSLATYIPQLSRADPNKWAMSICTVDGQRKNWGDFNETFCIQSVSKPFSYALAIEELGADYVHRFVGQEPSGRFFNEICLNYNNKPHNPMVNAGAIVVASLLKPQNVLSDRFDYTIQSFKRFAGGNYVSFDNATFLSERETADRNYALAYFLREHKCFPKPNVYIQDTMDLYFQQCSIKLNTTSLAIMASTLANGGVNPLTDEHVVCNRAVRDTLSLMLSCGMYDFSGQFAFNVGLPAKSGVSGNIIIVIPNLMGIALYSPRLDPLGNSVRGVKFAEALVKKFNFHHYDNLLYVESEKIDPRATPRNQNRLPILMEAAKNDDILTLKKEILMGTSLEDYDYDNRTVLHIAASEGSDESLEFLLSRWTGTVDVEDRFGCTPLDNAIQFKKTRCVELLQNRN